MKDYWYISGKAFKFIPVYFNEKNNSVEAATFFYKLLLITCEVFWDIFNFKYFSHAPYTIEFVNSSPGIYYVLTELKNDSKTVESFVIAENFEEVESVMRVLNKNTNTPFNIVSIIRT